MQGLSSERSHRVGIDIGGTFTDLVLIDDATGERAIGKVLTTPDDPSEAVEEGLRGLLERQEVGASQLKTIIHGTTLVTNALIERRGAATALLATEGFRDAVAIGTEHRYDMYDIFLEKPEPLVPRSLRYGIRERVLDDGSVLRELDEEQVSVGDGRLLAAAGVAGRAGVRAGALGAYLGQAERADAGDGAAAGPDLDHLYDGRLYRKS